MDYFTYSLKESKKSFNYYSIMSLTDVKRYDYSSLSMFLKKYVLLSDEIENKIQDLVEISLKKTPVPFTCFIDYERNSINNGFYKTEDYCLCSLLSPYLLSISDPYRIEQLYCCSQIVRRNEIFYFSYTFINSFKLLVFGGKDFNEEDTELGRVTFAFVVDFILDEFTWLNSSEVSQLVSMLIYSDYYNLSLCNFYVDRVDPAVMKAVTSFMSKLFSDEKFAHQYCEEFDFTMNSRQPKTDFLISLAQAGIMIPSAVARKCFNNMWADL